LRNGNLKTLPIYKDKENVSGRVFINLNGARKFDHTGIKIELVGYFEIKNEKSFPTRFISVTKDLESEGNFILRNKDP
jgi:vacuolar protein sorting-associated protein 26